MADWVSEYYSNKGFLGITSFNGTTINDSSGTPISIPGSNINLQDIWDAGAVRYDDVNGDLLDSTGTAIPILSAATNADLAAASSTSGKITTVFDPGDNGTTGLPADVYSDGSVYRFVGGAAIIAGDSPFQTITCPAATFTGSYTLADAGGANAGKASISSAGVHGLSTVGNYIMVQSGTGWTAGPVKILEVTDTDTLVLDHAYDAGLGQPTLSLAGSNFLFKRLRLPPLNNNSRVMIRITYDHGHAVADSTDFWMEHVALGGASGSVSGSDFYDPAPQTTNAPILHSLVGFYCASSATTKAGIQVKTDVDGFGLNNTGDEPSWTLAHALETDVIMMMNIQTANDTIQIGMWELEVRL